MPYTLGVSDSIERTRIRIPRPRISTVRKVEKRRFIGSLSWCTKNKGANLPMLRRLCAFSLLFKTFAIEEAY